MDNKQGHITLLDDEYPDIAIPPGEFLQEVIGHMGMNQSELAKRTNKPLKTINEIIKGKTAIIPEVAFKFEHVLQTPAYVWLRLERNYQYNKARLAEQERLKIEAKELSRFPYQELANSGMVAKTTNRIERTSELLKFFQVSSLSQIQLVHEHAFRISRKRDASPESLAAWIRIGQIKAEQIETNLFDRDKLKRTLPEFRNMTLKRPHEFINPLMEQCRACGVALVFTPHLKKTYANGVTMWLKPNKNLLQLSIRSRTNDVFWFSFFHEIGHILLHGKGNTFIETDNTEKSILEKEADEFAANCLIPERAYQKFIKTISQTLPSRSRVKQFAGSIGIDPGIVVGRLQFDHHLPFSHLNDMKKKYQWKTTS